MLDCQLFGLNAGRHHLVNVLLHIANTILLFLVLYRMKKGFWQSAFVAGLFALHPLHVESVAWVSERKDVLSTLFWILTMGVYAYYVERPGYKRYILVFLFFVLGLMAKPMLVTLPFVLLLLDFWPLKRLQVLQADALVSQPVQRSKKKSRQQQDTPQKEVNIKPRTLWQEIKPLVWEKIPLFVITAVFCFVTVYAQHGVVRPMILYPLDCRVANALISYVSYIGKMFWPVKLSVFYPYSLATLFSWQAAGAILILAIATYFSFRVIRRFPYFIVGWFWYLGTLIPVIGLVQVGLQSMADRYTYVPLIGLFIMVACGISELLKKWRHKREMLSTSVVIVILCFLITTWTQAGYWQNSIALFDHALKVMDRNTRAYINLSSAYNDAGNYRKTIEACDEAIKIDARYQKAYYNRGLAYSRLGNYRQALTNFDKAIVLNASYAEAYYNRAASHYNLGNQEQAFADMKAAARFGDQNARSFLRSKGMGGSRFLLHFRFFACSKSPYDAKTDD